MERLTIKVIEDVIKSISTEDDLQPYKDLGDGLYELPGHIISNEKGLNEYLKELRNKIKEGL